MTIKYVPWGGNSPVERLFAKVAGPISGDLRLARGIKPSRAGGSCAGIGRKEADRAHCNSPHAQHTC